MSFGFSVGDFVTVGTLAFELRRAYASAPEEYRSLSSDLDIFRGLVSQFERDVRIPMSPLNRCSPEQQLQLVLILGRANSILKELGIIRDNFQSFQSHPRVWDRLRFPSAKVRALQANLHLQTSTMKLFLASLTTTVVARIMTIIEDQERLYQANWTTLLTLLAERGIAEEMAAPYRGQLEMHVQAIHEVAESERELSAQSNPHTNPFQSENSEGSVIYGDSDISVDDAPMPIKTEITVLPLDPRQLNTWYLASAKEPFACREEGLEEYGRGRTTGLQVVPGITGTSWSARGALSLASSIIG
jgi:hypothetical protein